MESSRARPSAAPPPDSEDLAEMTPPAPSAGILPSAYGDLGPGHKLRAHWRDELERWSSVNAHLPLPARCPVGMALALSRRTARYLLRWYINPIVEQQNRFNAAATSLDALDDTRVRELEREVRDLRARVAALEARAGSPALDAQDGEQR